jgi:hypothetical protein
VLFEHAKRCDVEGSRAVTSERACRRTRVRSGAFAPKTPAFWPPRVSQWSLSCMPKRAEAAPARRAPHCGFRRGGALAVTAADAAAASAGAVDASFPAFGASFVSWGLLV